MDGEEEMQADMMGGETEAIKSSMKLAPTTPAQAAQIFLGRSGRPLARNEGTGSIRRRPRPENFPASLLPCCPAVPLSCGLQTAMRFWTIWHASATVCDALMGMGWVPTTLGGGSEVGKRLCTVRNVVVAPGAATFLDMHCFGLRPRLVSG